MEKREYLVYKFEELPKESQKKAIERHRDSNVDYWWWDLIYEEWKAKLLKMGFEDVKISFSGFYSQGDGASFTSSRVDGKKLAKAMGLLIWHKDLEKADCKLHVVSIDSHYSHPNTVKMDYELWQGDMPDKQYDRLETMLSNVCEAGTPFVREISRKIYKELEKQYTHLTSDSEVANSLMANDYWFTLDGKID